MDTVTLTGKDSLIASPLTIGELIQVMGITGVSSLLSPVGDGWEVKVTLTALVEGNKSTELKFSSGDRGKEVHGRVVGIMQGTGDTSNE